MELVMTSEQRSNISGCSQVRALLSCDCGVVLMVVKGEGNGKVRFCGLFLWIWLSLMEQYEPTKEY
jgi:hypothetical protein